jgi:hypothetical protein
MDKHAGGHAKQPLFSGSPETFQHDSVGTFTESSFPTGWFDSAEVDPNSTAPDPSVVVIKTTDASGHQTKALATLPDISINQGIYRDIDSTSGLYRTSADVRVDQFGDVDKSVIVPDPNNPGFLLCGCPIGAENLVDWPMEIGFNSLLPDSPNFSETSAVGIVASADDQNWHMAFLTPDIVKDIDMGVHIELGKWYGVETDFDANSGVLHGLLADKATGQTLADISVNVKDFGNYNQSVDGVFNTEGYFSGEDSLVHSSNPTLTRPNLAVIDNIDVPNPHAAPSFGDRF